MSDVSILAPIAITDAMLVSSTAAENDYAAWNSSATYTMGNRVISTITHRIYESAQAGNNNKDPTNIINRAGTVIWWIDLGPTNQRAMFDGLVSTQTSVASPLTLVLRPGVFNAFFLGGLDADAISYVVKDAPGGAVISSYSGVLEGSAPADYYEFFFERFRPQTDFIASNIPEYHAAELTLTLTKVTGNVKLGILAIGDLQPFAPAQYGVKVKPKTWSYIKVDDNGNATIKKRRSGKDITVNALVELENADTVLDAITFVLDVPCVMICSDAVVHRGMRGFGLVSGELSYDHKTKCNLTLTQQGLI